jgi:flagellar biogenesis protein FliO
LAAVGGLSVASKRFLSPRNSANALRVLGRTSLSPKHSVYLLEVGQRILIIGTGAQGAPSLLGVLTDPAEREAFLGTPRRVDANVSVSIRPSSAPGRFDRRVGDDE